jgi:hypothetical protein
MAPAAYVGAAAAVGGLALNIANSSGGGSSAPSGGYQLGNPLQQDTSFNNLSNLMYNDAVALPQQLLPGYQQATQNITNNPYAGLQQQGANLASGIGMNTVAPWQLGGAASLYSGANQIMQTAFDPQGDLYNTEQQKLTDQINAANAAAGLSGPAAAGVSADALSGFNIDWQNNLLQRQLAGLTGAGRGFAGASDLGGLGLQTLQSSAGAPYATYLGQQRDIIGGLNALSTGANAAFSLPQQVMTNDLNYLGRSSQAAALALAAQGQGFDQSSQLGSALTNSLYGVGNAFGGNQTMTPGGGGGLSSMLNQLFAPPGNSFTGGGNISTGGNVSGFGNLFGSTTLGQDPFAGMSDASAMNFGY